jgi:hypothetical protein
MSSQASGGRCEAAITDNSSYTAFVQSSSLSSAVSSVTKARKPMLRQIFNSIVTAWYTFSDWLMAWTPFCLVVSYFIVVTAIFVMCSTTAITVFYYFYMVANLYIAVVAVIESFHWAVASQGGAGRRRQGTNRGLSHTQRRRSANNEHGHGGIST